VRAFFVRGSRGARARERSDSGALGFMTRRGRSRRPWVPAPLHRVTLTGRGLFVTNPSESATEHADINELLEAVYSPSLRVRDWLALSPTEQGDVARPRVLTRRAWQLIRRRRDLRHHDERDLVQDMLEWLISLEWLGEASASSLGFDPANADPTLPPEEAFLAYLTACLRRQWRITSKKWVRGCRSDYAGGYEIVRLDEGWELAEKIGGEGVVDFGAFDQLLSSRLSVNDVASVPSVKSC
jgi:hypothetical protein